MSSFVENSAASETQEHPAQNSMELPYGGVDGSDIYAPPHTTMLPPNSSQPVPDTMDEAPYQPEDFSSGGIADKQFEPEGFTSGGNDVDVVNPTVVIEQNNDTALTNDNNNSGEVIKRKRGRPRKYPLADGSMVPISSPPQSGGVSAAIVAVQGSSGKRGRGRPPGSRGKHKAALTLPVSPAFSGSAGVGFTPHVVTVTAGEDVLARLMSFSQLNTQAVCILSANGTISNVTLQQPSSSGGTVTYEGRFEILSLSGSFLLVESNGQRSRTGGLSVSLAGPDGRVLGGGVAGLLTAASPVQIIVGTFMGAGQQVTRLGSNEGFTAPPKPVSGASVGGSPPSRGTLSESSGGPGSPLNYNTGGCDNSNQQTIPNVTWM